MVLQKINKNRHTLVIIVLLVIFIYKFIQPDPPFTNVNTPVDGPTQTLPDPTNNININKWQLIPKANYQIEARVIRTKRYRWNSTTLPTSLCPLDIGLAWGTMANPTNLNACHWDYAVGD